VKGQETLSRHVIFENVLMLFAKKIIKISMCLAKLQPAKIGAFLLRQECTSDAMLTRQLHSFSAQCGLVYYYQQAAAS